MGGSRTQRAAWAPYFQDVDAIIFLAPISGFDQVLVEDSSVNRLEDTVQLWKQVCSHPLLSRCNVILFMNKTDLMAKKLEAGVRLSRYIPSFGDRSNDFKTASSCECFCLEYLFSAAENALCIRLAAEVSGYF